MVGECEAFFLISCVVCLIGYDASLLHSCHLHGDHTLFSCSSSTLNVAAFRPL
jgi:hypothetical protein